MDMPEWFASFCLGEALPKWALALVIIAAIIVGFWLLLFISSLCFTLHFRKRLRKLSTPLNLLLYERRDALLALVALLDENRVRVPEADRKALDLLERIDDFQALSKKERDRRVLGFVHAAHNIITIGERRKKVASMPSFKTLIERLAGIDDVYRQKSALYNSRVLGYNYWSNMITCRHLFRLFGLKKKDCIV